MKLRVSIGSGPHDLTTAWVNLEDKPTEVESEYWVGRVLVRVRDFDGFTPDGSPPATHSEYFEGRNRRFHIQAEGRFKKQYNGDQVWFGTQFDHMIGNFPETLFNAGMRIAKYIDPAVFYDKNAAKPYIMSPYLACVNTLSAWPAPHRSHDAVLALENGNALTESDDEQPEDEVPRAETEHHKKDTSSKAIRYWSFQGFREDENSDMLQRAYTRNEDHPDTPALESTREGSIKTQSTKFDGEKSVTAEHPNHRIALTRLGSYGRDAGAQRSSVIGSTGMEELEEEETSEEDEDNQSFHTAVEYIVEDEVQPDGTIIPVKKKKKGLSVKKVRKSLHIPSAKTVQKNMRSLSIRRKDKHEPMETHFETTPRSSFEVLNRGSVDSRPDHVTRKSLDLMRPFRFGHHDKESSNKSGGRQVPSSSSPVSQDSKTTTHTSPATAQSAQTKSIRSPPTISSPLFSNTVQAYPQPRVSIDTQSETLHSLETSKSITSAEVHPIASETMNSVEIERKITASTDGQASSTAESDTRSKSSASKNPSKTLGTTEIRGDELLRSPVEDDGISHRLDDKLGPWRFSNLKIEPIEDTAFIFGDTQHSVKDRRKYFAKDVNHRVDFDFDPDIVYCMSFFLPYMNFNTFDLKLGPLGANLHKYVDDQPVRYMARCSERPDEVFFLVEFALE